MKPPFMDYYPSGNHGFSTKFCSLTGGQHRVQATVTGWCLGCAREKLLSYARGWG